MPRLLIAATAIVALSFLPSAYLQQCGNEDVSSRGAKGNGANDDTGAFQALDGDGSAGVIYMSKGTYRITRTIQLNKPIVATEGAEFKLDPGVTLTLYNQPQHPYSTFFTGAGSVVFTTGTQYVFPEWWGAAANGRADDSTAVQKAYDAARVTGNAMVYLRGAYGIGKATPLVFPPGANIVAEEGASFVAVGGNTQGITFSTGNSGVKSVLPNLKGFSDFCFRLQGLSLGAMQLRDLSDCGDAIRLESTGVGMHALDNTVWFNTISNSRVGIAIRANSPTCTAGNCIFQGNHFVGNTIKGGPSSGPSYAVFFSSPVLPAWDSCNFDIKTIDPPKNPAYRVFAANPAAHGEILKISALGALPHPASRVFDSNKFNMMQINIKHKAPLQNGQFGLWGELNVVDLSGALTPASPNTPVKCTNTPNSQKQFNGGLAIHGTYNTLQAVPTSDWPSGEVREFYFYHQQATQYLYQIKCGSTKNKQGLPNIDCLQFQDHSVGANPVPFEVKLWLINQSGGTVKKGKPATFTIAIQTLGNPAGS